MTAAPPPADGAISRRFAFRLAQFGWLLGAAVVTWFFRNPTVTLIYLVASAPPVAAGTWCGWRVISSSLDRVTRERLQIPTYSCYVQGILVTTFSCLITCLTFVALAAVWRVAHGDQQDPLSDLLVFGYMIAVAGILIIPVCGLILGRRISLVVRGGR